MGINIDSFYPSAGSVQKSSSNSSALTPMEKKKLAKSLIYQDKDFSFNDNNMQIDGFNQDNEKKDELNEISEEVDKLSVDRIARDISRGLERTALKLSDGTILQPKYNNHDTIISFFDKIGVNEEDLKEMKRKLNETQNKIKPNVYVEAFINSLDKNSKAIKILALRQKNYFNNNR